MISKFCWKTLSNFDKLLSTGVTIKKERKKVWNLTKGQRAQQHLRLNNDTVERTELLRPSLR